MALIFKKDPESGTYEVDAEQVADLIRDDLLDQLPREERKLYERGSNLSEVVYQKSADGKLVIRVKLTVGLTPTDATRH